MTRVRYRKGDILHNYDIDFDILVLSTRKCPKDPEKECNGKEYNQRSLVQGVEATGEKYILCTGQRGEALVIRSSRKLEEYRIRMGREEMKLFYCADFCIGRQEIFRLKRSKNENIC